MAWIALHQSVWTHRKTYALADALDIDEMLAAAHVIRLWTWALDNAPEGALGPVSPRVIAKGAGWTGDPAAFSAALVSSGWLDQLDDCYRIHDWDDYAGKLIEKRRSDAERLRRWRSAAKAETQSDQTHVNGASRTKRVSSHVPDLTGPDSTGPDPTGDEAGARAKPTLEPANETPAAVAAPPKQAIPKIQPPGPEFAPLSDAFRELGLPVPPLDEGVEIAAARKLLKRGPPGRIAQCWQEVTAGDYGGHLDRIKVCFRWLNTDDFFVNWLNWKEGGSPPHAGTSRNGSASRASKPGVRHS